MKSMMLNIVFCGALFQSILYAMSDTEEREFYNAHVTSIQDFRDRLDVAEKYLEKLKNVMGADKEAIHKKVYKPCWEALFVDNFCDDNSLWREITKEDFNKYINLLATFCNYTIEKVAMGDQKEQARTTYRGLIEDIKEAYQNTVSLSVPHSYLNSPNVLYSIGAVCGLMACYGFYRWFCRTKKEKIRSIEGSII